MLLFNGCGHLSNGANSPFFEKCVSDTSLITTILALFFSNRTPKVEASKLPTFKFDECQYEMDEISMDKLGKERIEKNVRKMDIIIPFG